jgi:hypothetical protein
MQFDILHGAPPAAPAGDIVELEPSGALRVVDRRKALVKMAQGEYIALERLEATYKGSGAAEYVLVAGDPLQRRLVAVVVPRRQWCASTILHCISMMMSLQCYIRDRCVHGIVTWHYLACTRYMACTSWSCTKPRALSIMAHLL